jgi:hypothetical protein
MRKKVRQFIKVWIQILNLDPNVLKMITNKKSSSIKGTMKLSILITCQTDQSRVNKNLSKFI